MPQALAFGQSSHTAAVKSYLRWGLPHFEGYASMMVLDALIYNTDRHLTNSACAEQPYGRAARMAPVFDNGRSLFFNLAFDQVDSFPNEAQFVLPSWSQVTFDEQAARLIGPRQKEQLAALGDFSFANCEQYPFPEIFLEKLAGHVRRRAEELATLPNVSREELLARC